jgi:predicted transposase/invertase (TIGR01784 family)
LPDFQPHPCRDQLLESENYPALRPTIAVCFVDTPLFQELDDYHLVFDLRERRHRTLFTDQLALHILELPKFNKEVGDLATPLDRWLFFLRHGEELDAQAVPKTLDVPEVRWALGDLFMISRTDPDRELYQAQLKARRDSDAQRQASREEGLAEGLAEGRASLRRADIQSLQKLLGHDVTPLVDLQALSLEELEGVWSRLQSDLQAKLSRN